MHPLTSPLSTNTHLDQQVITSTFAFNTTLYSATILVWNPNMQSTKLKRGSHEIHNSAVMWQRCKVRIYLSSMQTEHKDTVVR